MTDTQTRILLAALLLAATGCASTHANRDPTGTLFPTVTGTRLDGRPVALPGAFAGEPSLLLVGYKMRTQFDIDRWMLGLHDTGIDVPVYELPTILGFGPRLVAGSIDEGMRQGIPEEDWGIVITVYRDADRLARFLGNENPLPARVVLLDGQGRVAWFYDRGYTVTAVMTLAEVLDRLHEETMPVPFEEHAP